MTTHTDPIARDLAAPPAGFTLPCPHCGEREASIAVHLATLEDDPFVCGECEATFSIDHVRSLIRRWTRVLAWLENVPQFADDE